MASPMVTSPVPVGVVHRFLTPRRLHRLARGGQFAGLLGAFLLLLWVTPLAGTIDDEFRLTPRSEQAPTVLLTMGEAGSGPEGAAAGDGTGTPPLGSGEDGQALGTEGGTEGEPSGGSAGSPGPATSSPTPPATSSPAAGLAAPGGPAGSGLEPTDTTDPAPPATSAPPGTADATRVATMLAAGLGRPDAAFTAAEQRCLADALAGAHDPATLAAMATATSPAGLGSALTTLAHHLGTCFPLRTAVLASLLEGDTPAPVASCLAPEIASRITWEPLLVLELSPTDPAANDVLASAAVAASALCPLG